MAKVTVAGKAIVITSTLKLADLETLKKYASKSLILMGGEDGKEPIFAVTAVPGSAGKVNKYSLEFGDKDPDGFAVITIMAPVGVDDMKEFVADTYGQVLMNLAQLEAQLPAVIEDLAAKKAAIVDSIVVAG